MRAIILVAIGRESSDTAVVRGHAGEDLDSAVTSGIRRAQSATDFDNNAGAAGEVSAKALEKGSFPGVARLRRAELANCGTVGTALHSSSGSNFRLRTAWCGCEDESAFKNGNAVHIVSSRYKPGSSSEPECFRPVCPNRLPAGFHNNGEFEGHTWPARQRNKQPEPTG
jgi:hypothetical protein